ncbi:MAG: hypothetical protein QOG51_1579 [Verrucomicrobiota bacterium]
MQEATRFDHKQNRFASEAGCFMQEATRFDHKQRRFAGKQSRIYGKPSRSRQKRLDFSLAHLKLVNLTSESPLRGFELS